MKNRVWHELRPGAVGVALVGLTLARLVLTRGQTIMALGPALHDDGLFLRLAAALRAGDWLGPYDQLTLVKGPFYPAWVAGIHALGLPLLLAEQALYLLACVALAAAVRPLVSRRAVLLTYCVLLFNPASYTDQVTTRVSREGVYSSLTLFVIAFVVGLVGRKDSTITAQACWSSGLGLSLASFWLIREEGTWLLSSVLLLIGVAAVAIWRAKPPHYWLRLLLCGLPIAIWLLSLAGVAAYNASRYGVFATVELKSAAFLAGYGSLLRVEHTSPDPRVPVPRDTRERVYAVSPAFAELKPFLEGSLGRGWTATSCRAFSVCGDIGGGWFLWALRDAAAAAGHHRSGSAAASYYQRLAAEVNAGCARGELRCAAERATLSPRWSSEIAAPALRAFLRGGLALARFEGFAATSSPSVGSPEQLTSYRLLTHGRLSPRYMIRGWAVSPLRAITLEPRRRDGVRVVSSVRWLASPDVELRFRGSGAPLAQTAFARFEITTNCRRGCDLLVTSGADLVGRVPLDQGLWSAATPALYLELDYVGYEEPPFNSRVDALMLEWLGQVAGVYATICLPLLFLALAAYALDTARALRDRAFSPRWWIASALLLGIVVRLILLSVLQVTSFPALGLGRLAAAHPLLLVFLVLMLTDRAARRSRAAVGPATRRSR